MKTSDLTEGERLLVDRRRRDESQRDAAARLGVTLYRYRALESGEADADAVAVGPLRPHERFFLLRRRHGISVGEIAAALGSSRWWVTQMEKGRAPAGLLEAYWAETSAAC